MTRDCGMRLNRINDSREFSPCLFEYQILTHAWQQSPVRTTIAFLAVSLENFHTAVSNSGKFSTRVKLSIVLPVCRVSTKLELLTVSREFSLLFRIPNTLHTAGFTRQHKFILSDRFFRELSPL